MKSENKQNEFDLKARDWELNPMHLERAQSVTRKLMEMIPLHSGMKTLEFGAGTGLMSFLLQPLVDELTLLDSSSEMIRVCQEKIDKVKVSNMKTLCLNLEKDSFNGSFDLIFSLMVFHHVENIDLIVSKFKTLLKSGGFLAIADLYPEDGSFHGPDFKGPKGFDPVELANQLSQHGFSKFLTQQAYVVKKEDLQGNQREYPVFLMVASL